MSTYDDLNKLCKWRKVFAGWQLGTVTDSDGAGRAVRDHREVTMLLRAEVSGLVALLVRKGVFTAEEWEKQVGEEARTLDEMYEVKFPGFSTSQDGVHMQMPQAGDTMRRLGFPP
jgi:hypothetical protein